MNIQIRYLNHSLLQRKVGLNQLKTSPPLQVDTFNTRGRNLSPQFGMRLDFELIENVQIWMSFIENLKKGRLEINDPSKIKQASQGLEFNLHGNSHEPSMNHILACFELFRLRHLEENPYAHLGDENGMLSGDAKTLVSTLTERSLQVLELFPFYPAAKSTGAVLGIDENAVYAHHDNIQRNLGGTGTYDAFWLAYRKGLIDLPYRIRPDSDKATIEIDEATADLASEDYRSAVDIGIWLTFLEWLASDREAPIGSILQPVQEAAEKLASTGPSNHIQKCFRLAEQGILKVNPYAYLAGIDGELDETTVSLLKKLSERELQTLELYPYFPQIGHTAEVLGIGYGSVRNPWYLLRKKIKGVLEKNRDISTKDQAFFEIYRQGLIKYIPIRELN